jgi:hypothetical protein
MSDADLTAAIYAITPATPVEHLADVIGRLDAAMRRAKELKRDFESRLLAVIEETGRDVVVNETRYYAAFPSDTKCPDRRRALRELLDAAGGDIDVVADCLASDAFKPGACRAVLPAPAFDRAFVTTRRAKLGEGVPRRELMSMNERFAKERT